MWSFADDYGILPNLYVRSRLKDGVLQYFQIYPCDRYVLRVPIMDEYQMDEEGNYVFDENGESILVMPYRTWGGATALKNYDFTTNPSGFCAELYDESMTIFGDVTDKPIEEPPLEASE